MRLPALIVLTILSSGACSRSSDLASCRLVGTWKHVVRLPKTVEAELGARGETPEAIIAAEVPKMLEDGTLIGETFGADGSCVMAGMIFEHDFKRASTWRIVAEDGDRLSISIADPKAEGGQYVRTFVFESANLIREETGLMRGTRYERVK